MNYSLLDQGVQGRGGGWWGRALWNASAIGYIRRFTQKMVISPFFWL